jgi:hypothetical protein
MILSGSLSDISLLGFTAATLNSGYIKGGVFITIGSIINFFMRLSMGGGS